MLVRRCRITVWFSSSSPAFLPPTRRLPLSFVRATRFLIFTRPVLGSPWRKLVSPRWRVLRLMRHTILLLSILRMITLATSPDVLTTGLALAATGRAMVATVVTALVIVVALNHHPLGHPLLSSSNSSIL